MTREGPAGGAFATLVLGWVAERLKAPVLKTGRGFSPLVGSNPTPSASPPHYTRLRPSLASLALPRPPSRPPYFSRPPLSPPSLAERPAIL